MSPPFRRRNCLSLLAATRPKRYRVGMGVWDELQHNVRNSTRQWLDWAHHHAQEIGDTGMRHIERQDLLAERRQLLLRLGELLANRFLVEGKKTVRSDSPEFRAALERISEIDRRLEELAEADKLHSAKKKTKNFPKSVD